MPLSQARPSVVSLVVACLVALLMTSACGTSAPSSDSQASTLDPRLLGEWQIDGGATYTITAQDGDYALAIVDYDGEVFHVRSLTWEDGVLAWTYYVPSTDVSVSEQTISISENQLEVQWENTAGDSGVDVFNRVQ